MPDYNLNSIISNTGDDLIEIGFDVEGYEVEYLRGVRYMMENGADAIGDGFGADAVSVSTGGYIDEAASKQLVVSWTNHQSIVVKVVEEDAYAMCKCDLESKLGLPNSFIQELFTSRKGLIQTVTGGDSYWLTGAMVTANCIAEYVKHFYPDCEWTLQHIQQMISSRLINAQICFALNDSGTYFNTTIVEAGGAGFSDTAVSIDTQLFLSLNTLKNDFVVTVTDRSNKSENVDGKKLAPLATTDYIYEACSLGGYDINHTGYYGSSSNEQYSGEQAFSKVSVSSSKYQQARIRFFVRSDNKPAIEKILGDKKIPEGLIGEPLAYYTEAVSAGGSMTMQGDGSWPYFPPQYADGRGLTALNFKKACRIMWFFEIGTCDPSAQFLAKRRIRIT